MADQDMATPTSFRQASTRTRIETRGNFGMIGIELGFRQASTRTRIETSIRNIKWLYHGTFPAGIHENKD